MRFRNAACCALGTNAWHVSQYRVYAIIAKVIEISRFKAKQSSAQRDAIMWLGLHSIIMIKDRNAIRKILVENTIF